MKRREFIIGLGSIGLSPLIARAQPLSGVHSVGVLCSVSCETSDLRTFREELATRGYKEGANVVFEYRSAAGDLSRLPALANELVRENVDVIFTTFGTAAGLAAKRATGSIPVVVGSAGDLVAAKIVESLSRPGGNVTGITSLLLELEGKRLQLLKELMPNISRIGFFCDATNPFSILSLERLRNAAPKIGVELREIQVHESAEVDQAFETMVSEGLEALCV